MRRFQKEQLSKNVNLLREAGSELTKLQPGAQKINLCADIQDFVLAILNFAESVIEKDTELTELLSEAYIMLLKASQEETDTESVLAQLDKISSCVADMGIDKMEVVFFCHKASISGCLERIYLDIKKHDTCDVYFIPVPYYDKNEDGSLAKMRYEAAGYYPNQFELRDWRTYDVKKRHPDIVFITDPYDGYGPGAVVHPDFYASRLRELTDMLVYVHHDSYSGIADSDIKKLPGIVLSDKVVVESEELRQQYIRMLLSQEKEMSSEMAEKKIVTIDSLNIM